MIYDDDIEGENDAPVHIALGALAERTPSVVERQVGSVSRNSSLDDICAMLDAADWLLARAKSIHHIATQKVIEWIQANGPFDIGTIHYDVGHTTTVRCTNLKLCAHELLDCLGGDFEGFLDVLVAQPYKSSTARAILTEPRYRNLFTIKSTFKLIGGAPSRGLKLGLEPFRR